jgi:hypothetical protein
MHALDRRSLAFRPAGPEPPAASTFAMPDAPMNAQRVHGHKDGAPPDAELTKLVRGDGSASITAACCLIRVDACAVPTCGAWPLREARR